LAADVQAYANRYGIAHSEAAERLAYHDKISSKNLHNLFSVRAPASYAGMHFEHMPEHRLMVHWVGPAPELSALLGPDAAALSNKMILAPANLSYATLSASLEDSAAVVDLAGVAADIALDVRSNRIAVYVIDANAAQAQLDAAQLELPPGAEFVEVDGLMTLTADISGGYPLSACTSGFSVTFGSYTGITTAGHCPPVPGTQQQYFGGVLLPYQSGATSGPYDVQWHTVPGYTATNNIFIGEGGYRDIFRYKSRLAQTPGDWVCKYGMATLYTCATIIDNQFRPNTARLTNPTATYIRAGDSGERTTDEGDSGGPVFFGSTALGTVTGRLIVTPYTVHMIYMPAEYIEQYGLDLIVN